MNTRRAGIDLLHQVFTIDQAFLDSDFDLRPIGLDLLARFPVPRVAAAAPLGLMFFVAEQMGKLAAQGAFYEDCSQILEQVLNISKNFPVGQELINDLRIKLGVFRFDAAVGVDIVFLFNVTPSHRKPPLSGGGARPALFCI